MSSSNTFSSDIFKSQIKQVEIAGETESVMNGYNADGSRNFDGLKKAMAGVKQFAIIGWSSQGPAQAQNVRESFKAAGLDIKVVVGLREGSSSRKRAEEAKFSENDGSLLSLKEAISTSDVVLMLIADAGMAKDGEKLLECAKPGTTIGLSHGFYLGHLETMNMKFRDDIDVIGVCPKGMGPSVRRLYEQGSGINDSFAVVQGGDDARDKALAWSLALGSPYTFQTTLENEWRSDVFGERAMLLGGVHGVVEAMYAWKRQHGVDGQKAYLEVVESVVGPISRTISHDGLKGLYDALDESQQAVFQRTYNASYPVLRQLTEKIYNDVSSGREIAEVISDNDNDVPMTVVDGTEMWRDGDKVRAEMKSKGTKPPIDADVAAVYVAGMIAQVDILRSHGHFWSEVVNESIIEAVDSLNPYMRARGVSFMVDNCSVTARRGSRKWAPAYHAWISQGILPVIDGVRAIEDSKNYFDEFMKHDTHDALSVLGKMRPPIDISL